ncbi:MAG TPA: NAD(P)H-hydrate dehydratase [Pyrinomonadaceae bacterium]|nr:NAD(P)H-hydrate dehydratase [Pyrinomonadaceae bacterium]
MPKESRAKSSVAVITPKVLARLPLPQPAEDDDKEERGRVLVVGGSAEMPGAVILSAVAALRAGAGKIQIATVKSVAPHVGANVPEGRVFALPETKRGGISSASAARIAELAASAQSVVIGPGMIDDDSITRFAETLLPRLGSGAVVVLDAGALGCLAAKSDLLHGLRGNAVVTPHAGEMAKICGLEREVLAAGAAEAAEKTAGELRAVVAFKGRETFIAAPGSQVYCNRAGNVGLATSGSGDTLSGIVAGLAARGARPLAATVWGVHLHARAGDRLARRIGRLGFLARELLAEIPPLMRELTAKGK